MAAKSILLPGRPETALIRDNADNIEGLKQASFTENAPYVANVGFLASIPASHLLSYGDFKDSANQKAKSRHGQHSIEMEFPNLDAEYECHMRQMQEAPEDERVLAWAAALNKIGNQTTITTVTYSPTFQITTQAKGSETRETFELKVYDDVVVLNEAGDGLFQKVITTLAQVESPPKRLVMRHDSSGCTKWSEDPTNTDVVLKSLQYLEFGIAHRRPLNGNVDEDALNDLFTKLQLGCREYLEDLAISALVGSIGFGFPQEENLIEMSSLTRLHLQFCTIHVSNFAKFISLQKCLQSLIMSITGSYEGTGSWQEVWDVIRNYDKCLHLSLESAMCGSGHRLNIERWTVAEDGQKGLRSFYAAEPKFDKEIKLIQYLDKKQPWCTKLEDAFGLQAEETAQCGSDIEALS